MLDNRTTWTVTTTTWSLTRTGIAAEAAVGGQVTAAVLELVPLLSDPGHPLLVRVGDVDGRLYPGLDEAGEHDAAATAATCAFLLDELVPQPATRS